MQKTPKTNENSETIRRKIRSFLDDFVANLKKGEPKALPALNAKEYRYTVSVALVAAPIPKTLSKTEISNKLEGELTKLQILFDQRKAKFERDLDWEGSDEEELEPSSSASEEEYVIQEILREKIEGGVKYYLVRWAGAGGREWLPRSALTGFEAALEEFEGN